MWDANKIRKWPSGKLLEIFRSSESYLLWHCVKSCFSNSSCEKQAFWNCVCSQECDQDRGALVPTEVHALLQRKSVRNGEWRGSKRWLPTANTPGGCTREPWKQRTDFSGDFWKLAVGGYLHDTAYLNSAQDMVGRAPQKHTRCWRNSIRIW